MQKRGGTKQSIKIETSHILLSKRNIVFMLILILLLIMIIYFAIKTWPIMQERLGDGDNDGIKNYQDKCMSTPKGATVDSYGCEIVKGDIHVEKPVFVEEDIEEENETIIQCSDSDGGKNIWIKGICNDGSDKKDYCEENFGSKLYEYLCLNNICDKEKIYCSDYNALCYDGRCIEKIKDSDKDGYPDLSELGNGTDPNNPNDYPGGSKNCNSLCLSLGYIKGEGPVDSIGKCDSYEVGKYLSGNSGDICCCKDCGLWCKSSGWNYGTVTTKSNCNTYPTNYYDDSLGCCCHMETGTGIDCNAKCIEKGYLAGMPTTGPQCTLGTLFTFTSGSSSANCCCSGNPSIYRCCSSGSSYSCYQPSCPSGWTTVKDYSSQTECQSLCKTSQPVTDEEKCQQWMTSKGYNYWVLGLKTSTGCYDNGFRECYNKGYPNAISMYNSTSECCIWKCATQTDVQICQQFMTSGGYGYYNLGIFSSNDCINKATQYCTSIGKQYDSSAYQDPTIGCCAWKCKEPAPVCYNSNYEAGYRGIEILQHKGYCTDDGGITKHWHKCIDAPQVLEWWVCGEKCERYSYACRELIPYTYCSAYGIDWCERIPGTENIDPPECTSACSGYPRSILGSSGCPEVPPICKKLGSSLSSYTKKGGTNCCCFKCDEID